MDPNLAIFQADLFLHSKNVFDVVVIKAEFFVCLFFLNNICNSQLSAESIMLIVFLTWCIPRKGNQYLLRQLPFRRSHKQRYYQIKKIQLTVIVCLIK